MSSSAAFEAYLGRRRRSADPGCEVGGSEAAIPAAVLRRRQLPPTATQPRRQESCPGQVMTAKLAGIAGKKLNVVTERPLEQRSLLHSDFSPLAPAHLNRDGCHFSGHMPAKSRSCNYLKLIVTTFRLGTGIGLRGMWANFNKRHMYPDGT